jgi:hypothetical protein
MSGATAITERSIDSFLGPAHPFEDTEPASPWLALHIFYSSNNNPLLSDCVVPLLHGLRADGLLQRFFFIRYWMEGPHVRLRLRPRRREDEGEIRRRAEKEAEAFLARRPALYDLDPGVLAPMYKEMFLAEYTEQEWDAKYGASGQIPLRDNNSWAYVDYEPEHDRYGGPDGVRLAEWHFERSSTVVLYLTQTANVHVRTVLFGLATQMMAAIATAFLGSPADVAGMFEAYGTFWEQRSEDPTDTRAEGYERVYAGMAGPVVRRVTEIHAAVTQRDFRRLNGFMRHWAGHCVELREHVARLTAEQRMIFPVWGDAEAAPRPLTDLSVVLRLLLNGYVHMTNNRLGVSIVDEIYLAYVLKRAFTEVAETAAPS